MNSERVEISLFNEERTQLTIEVIYELREEPKLEVEVIKHPITLRKLLK